MSSKKKQAEQREEKDWEHIDNAVFESENFLAKHSKKLLIGLGVLVIIACGFLAYKQFYIKPLNQEAQVALYKGQEYFGMSQDSIALYGDGNGYVGFENISLDYSSTDAGKLAKAYAGLCYANLGQYQKAIEYLDGFNAGDKLVSKSIKGTIGDCYDNLGKYDEAIKYYEKAAKEIDSDLYSPIFLKKAALVYQSQGNYDKVIEIFTNIKNQYANSTVARDADKYIDEATILKENK